VSHEDDIVPEPGQDPKSSPGIGTLIDYNRRLRLSIEELKANHREEVRVLKKKIQDVENERDNTDERVAAAHAGFQEKEEQWRSYKEELESNIKALEDSQASLVQSHAEDTKRTAEELAQLNKSLAKTESKSDMLEKLKYKLLEQIKNIRQELNETKAKNTDLSGRVETLQAEREALADHASRIASLEAEKVRLQNLLSQQTEEIEKARRYNAEAEAREEENNRLKALAEQKTKEAEEAVRNRDKAEAQAFESRNKLLQFYTEEESKEILKSGLEEARSQIAIMEDKIEALTLALEKSQREREEIEEKILYSSDRESLKMSLASLAKRRKA
jgi:chromosome segregation ATPase